jgi:hypothetical protein
MVVIFFNPVIFKVILTLEKVGLKLPHNLPWYFYNIGPWRLFSRTLQPFTKNIKRESIYKSLLKCQAARLGLGNFRSNH